MGCKVGFEAWEWHCSRAPLYQNEDFVGDKGGMTLLEDVDLDTILEELNDAVEFVMNSADGMSIPLLKTAAADRLYQIWFSLGVYSC